MVNIIIVTDIGVSQYTFETEPNQSFICETDILELHGMTARMLLIAQEDRQHGVDNRNQLTVAHSEHNVIVTLTNTSGDEFVHIINKDDWNANEGRQLCWYGS